MESSISSQDKRRSNQPQTNQVHLLTPESPLLDSFSKQYIATTQAQASVPSPPASPQFSQQFQTNHDQQLFPESSIHNESALVPLFNESGWASRQRTPPTTERSHVLSAPSSPKVSPVVDNAQQNTTPKRFTNPVGAVALYNHYGYEYYVYMRAQMEDHRARMKSRTLPAPEQPHGADRDVYDRSVLRSLGRSGVEKPRTGARISVKTSKASRPTSSRAVPATTPVLSPRLPPTAIKREPPARRPRRTVTPDAAAGAMPGASKRTRAAPTKKLDGKGPSQWAELEDFCPPIDSLNKNGVELSVVWNNASALNLDTDVDRAHLHPQELKIASKLRLHCNEYLLNKRRIFAAKVKSLQDGNPFNKTSAQNATSVDVNKASRLWSAFDGAGWFDPEWFEQWM